MFFVLVSSLPILREAIIYEGARLKEKSGIEESLMADYNSVTGSESEWNEVRATIVQIFSNFIKFFHTVIQVPGVVIQLSNKQYKSGEKVDCETGASGLLGYWTIELLVIQLLYSYILSCFGLYFIPQASC